MSCWGSSRWSPPGRSRPLPRATTSSASRSTPGAASAKARSRPPPDYANTSSWAVLPKSPTKPVDVFFIYPTVYFSGEYWNAPTTNRDRARAPRAHHRPALCRAVLASANLFVPLYRQAAPYSFMTTSEDGREARELAYSDVALAFKSFVAGRNDGRPFIVAGYGQGALYGLRLIAELDPADRAPPGRRLSFGSRAARRSRQSDVDGDAALRLARPNRLPGDLALEHAARARRPARGKTRWSGARAAASR